MIGAVTAGCSSRKASDISISDSPASSASSASASAASSFAWFCRHRHVVALGDHLRRARLSAGSAPLRYLPVSQPPAERAPRDHADAVALAGGQEVALDRANEDRVRRLLGDEASRAALLGDHWASTTAEGGKVEQPM